MRLYHREDTRTIAVIEVANLIANMPSMRSVDRIDRITHCATWHAWHGGVFKDFIIECFDDEIIRFVNNI